MSKLLFVFLICKSAIALSQIDDMETNAVKDFKTFGYIDGIRLDTLRAAYAEIGWRNYSVYFDYGQGKKVKEMIVTDKDGRRIIHTKSEVVFWLNFFYFNGWENVTESSGYLLKRRQSSEMK